MDHVICARLMHPNKVGLLRKQTEPSLVLASKVHNLRKPG